MCGLDAVAVGKLDKDSGGNRLEVGAWAVDAQEARGAARVGSRSRVGCRVARWVESYGIKAKCVG